MTTAEKQTRPAVARRFTGIKFVDTDQGPETGEVGRRRIEDYARDRGWFNDKGDPDISRMVRHMVTEHAKVIERQRKKQAKAASTG
jgi:hypothetical protein